MADDPRQVAEEAREALTGLARQLRAGAGRTDDPRLNAMLETGAEAVLGLHNAVAGYLRDEEPGPERR